MRALLFLLALLWSSVGAAAPASWVRAPDDAGMVEALESEPPTPPEGWREFADPYATIYAAEDDEATALHLSRYTARSLPRLAEEMGLAIGSRIHIYLAPDAETFRALQPGSPPTWADGTAWPHRGLVFLRSPRVRGGAADPLEQVLDHELAHVLLGRAFGPREVPRWLQEGVAQLVAREYTPELSERLGAGTWGDNLLSVEELTSGFPADPLQARLAYAQSADLVAYLQTRFGDAVLHELIREMAAGSAFPAALRASTGLSVDELEQAWRDRLSSSGPLWLRPMLSETVFFSLIALGFVAGGAGALRRRRARLAAMAEEEAAQDAWYAEMQRRWSPMDGYNPSGPH